MCVCFFSKDHHSQPQKDQKKDTVSNSEMTAFYFFHRDFPNVCIPDSSATLLRRYSAPNLSLHREMSKNIPLQDSQKGQIISLDARTSLMFGSILRYTSTNLQFSSLLFKAKNQCHVKLWHKFSLVSRERVPYYILNPVRGFPNHNRQIAANEAITYDLAARYCGHQ